MESQKEITLTEAQLNDIADRAAEKALAKVYGEIGKAVVTRLFIIIGIIAVGIWVWIEKRGGFS